jgi:hypothetical protein
MNTVALHALGMLLQWIHPSPARAIELEDIAVDIGSTDASMVEAEELVAICLHETHCRLDVVGDGGRSVGPWQVRNGPPTAKEALRRVRQSLAAAGDLSYYACGKKQCDPRILESLLDPTLPRR